MSEQLERLKKEEQSARPAGPRGPGGRPGGPPGMRMPAEKPKNAKKTLGRLLAYIGARKVLLFALIGVMLATTLISLAGPSLQGMAIDTMTLTDKKLNVDFDSLVKILSVMVLLYAVSSGLTYFQGIFAAKLSQSTVKIMRDDLFAKIATLPIGYTDSHKHGDIMSRMTNDVENISNTISQSIGSLFSSVISIVGCLVLMLWYSPILTLVSFITIPITLIVTKEISKRTRAYFKKQQTLLGILNAHIEESVTAQKTVTAFSTQDKTIRAFRATSSELTACGIRAQIFGGVMGPVMNVIGNLNFLLIAAVGGALAFQGYITVGIIQAFILYSRQFTRPVTEVANQYAAIQTAIAGAERVFEVMDAEPELDAGTHALPKEDIRGDIDFENLVFSYKKGEPVLRDFSLSVAAGQKIAVVGATGSGKTTLVNLLTRFYETDGGKIKVDGVDVIDIPKADLRRALAIVLQDTVLFSDTIGANIRYGRPEATDEEVRRAAAIANADLFIERLPKQYDTELAEAGSNLSEGQRQLVSIARAVLADPKILILDEATSSVDTRTELHIQEAMLALMQNRTSLIIAHRLSTIRDADLIVVIDGGQIVEAGNHDELIEKRGRYYDLYQTQFSGVAT